MIIHNNKDRETVIAKIREIILNKPWDISCSPYKANRSLAQNRLSHRWYGELGKEYGREYERNYCKWHYGTPILLESDTGDFSAFYSKLINSYDYEECVKAMEFIQVTSLMGVKQMSEYLNHVELYAVERGIQLSKPEDLYYEAMGRRK